MAEPLLNSCCRCQSLRTGSIISGICGIFLALAALVAMFFTRVEMKTIIIDWLPSNIVKIILTINLCMTVIICMVMIFGVVKRNPLMMLPWIVLGIMLAIGLLISVIYTAVVFFIDGFAVSGIVWLIFGLISVVIYVYMWMVTYSYFIVIKDEETRGRYAKQPYRR